MVNAASKPAESSEKKENKEEGAEEKKVEVEEVDVPLTVDEGECLLTPAQQS
jgi:hypothetical protein